MLYDRTSLFLSIITPKNLQLLISYLNFRIVITKFMFNSCMMKRDVVCFFILMANVFALSHMCCILTKQSACRQK